MALNYDVIVIGSYSVDLIFTGLPEYPTLGKDIVATDFMMTPGEAFISAVCMHRLGLNVGWAGDFGNDDFSQFVLNRVREEGMDEELFVLHSRPIHRISAAASFPKERGFITYYDPEPSIPAAIPALINAEARCVLIPGLYSGSLFIAGEKLIRSKNMTLVMDGNSSDGNIVGRTKECRAIKQAIQAADIFLPNAMEARRISGEQDLELASQKLGELCPLVVIKDGANGSYSYFQGKITHVPSIKVEPVDTTGAGDNFNAGFIYAWLNGNPLKICQKWGNILGALSTTELGGTTRKITCDLVREHLRQQA